MEPYNTTEQLMETVAQRADDYRVLDRGPAGRPIGVARNVGEGPPILVTAGAHATEHAGVVAAVELLDRLETDYPVYVLPTRDPMGVDGFEAALEMASGGPATINSYEVAEEHLRMDGYVVVDDTVLVGLIGDYGFGVARPSDGASGSRNVSNALRNMEGTPEMEQLRGRRIFLLSGHPDVAGTGDFDRLYTRIVSPEGENLHLNRYVGSNWAPPESRVVRDLVDSIGPGLFVDLHEYSGDGYWVSTRPKEEEAAERAERAIGRAMTESVADAGGDLLPLAEYIDEDPAEHFFTELETGLWDLDYDVRRRSRSR